ncbi:hypothetical protein EJ110_NYTH05452 [Nymphaea thermarum]|nr:hypothetical protein EJ110_NYTH05452 [Nymphaea thermarum]
MATTMFKFQPTVTPKLGGESVAMYMWLLILKASTLSIPLRHVSPEELTANADIDEPDVIKEGLNVEKDLRVDETFEELEAQFEPGNALEFSVSLTIKENM